jgi:hypothetical protein
MPSADLIALAQASDLIALAQASELPPAAGFPSSAILDEMREERL